MHKINLIAIFTVLLLCVAFLPPARAANIITFDSNGNSCSGGAVICSTNGTTGYVNTNGVGVAFDLSTITLWFQIDTTGVNQLVTQTMAEPDGGAGGFLVTNDTGNPVTNFSLTLTDTFTSSTPSVSPCKGLQLGQECDNFQANKGSAAPSGALEALSGSGFDSCTNGSAMAGFPCASTAGQAAANFAPNSVTYNWTGLNIPTSGPGSTFLITFASLNNAASVTPPTQPPVIPEPSNLALFGTGLTLMWGYLRRRVLS